MESKTSTYQTLPVLVHESVLHFSSYQGEGVKQTCRTGQFMCFTERADNKGLGKWHTGSVRQAKVLLSKFYEMNRVHTVHQFKSFKQHSKCSIIFSILARKGKEPISSSPEQKKLVERTKQRKRAVHTTKNLEEKGRVTLQKMKTKSNFKLT